MTKVAITGRFATTTDVVRVHRISPVRQAWLEKQLSEMVTRGRGSEKKTGSRAGRIVRASARKSAAKKQ
jgi:hypothetical protein